MDRKSNRYTDDYVRGMMNGLNMMAASTKHISNFTGFST